MAVDEHFGQAHTSMGAWASRRPTAVRSQSRIGRSVRLDFQEFQVGPCLECRTGNGLQLCHGVLSLICDLLCGDGCLDRKDMSDASHHLRPAKRILASLDKASAQNRAATNKRARSALVLPKRGKRQLGIANSVGGSDRSNTFTPFADWEF
jgi:hypothetical protein